MFSAGGGLEKPNLGRDRGETFFPDSGSDLDSDETFQISRNVGLDIDEIVCLLDSQLWLNYVSCGILWQICLPKRDILQGFSVNH